MQDVFTTLVVVSLLLGFSAIIGLLVYDVLRRTPFFKKMSSITFCKIGWHTMYRRVNGQKRSTYFCVHCKKKRSFPDLKIIEGDSKLYKNDYKF